jgi:hypothetical protein
MMQHQVAANTRGHADHARILEVMQPEVEANTRQNAEQKAINAEQKAINAEIARNFAEQKAAMDNWYFLQLIQ